MSVRTTKHRPKHWKPGQIGEIVVEEIPYVSKGNKYAFYVILDKELPTDLLEDPDAEVFDYLYTKDWDICMVQRIERKQLPKDDQRFIRALKEVTPEVFKERVEGRPIYCIYLTVEDDFEGYRYGDYYVKKNEVAGDEFRRWLASEDYEVRLHSARKIRKFPWERKKISARIPLTEKMLKKVRSKKEAEVDEF